MFKKLFPIAILFCLFFPSCSSFTGSNESASINLEITGSLIEKLAESSSTSSSARSISGLEGVSQYKIKAVLTADGSEYVEESFIQKSSSSSVTITFPAVRAGSRAKIIVQILIGNYEYARGESDEITVKEGSNFLNIKIGKNAILPILLYNKIDSEKVFSLYGPDSNGKYSVTLGSDSVSFTRKAKLFAFINGGESPADGDLELPYTQSGDYKTYYTPTYSFGDNCLYWLYENKVYVYTAPDYNKTEEFDLISKFKEINTDLASNNNLTIKGLAYYDGNLYFFINDSTYPYPEIQYYFAAYNLADQTLIFASDNLQSGGAYKTPCDSLSVTKIGENYILCSINVSYSSPIALYIQKFTITKIDGEAGILTLDETPSIIDFPVTSDEFYNSSYDKGFGGLQILGNTLYVTCYFYRNSGNSVQACFLNPNTDSIYPVLSAGGLGKIDLSALNYEFGTWSNGEKLLGLYKNYYYSKNEDESYTKSSNAVIMTPPEDKAASYFYGAKRIIAKKQDEIVIADDGAYVEIKGDLTDPDAIQNCKNKNRVVTVNLKNESISAVDVNASFSSTVVTGTYYGIQ